MSLLIGGMEMPTEGGTIVVYKIGGNYFAARAGKDELFPIVSVPPHGRLGDLDELKTAFPCGESIRTESVRATIDHAPTIIPAEDGE